MSDVSHGSGLREHVLMVSRFLRSPRTVGAVSAELARAGARDGRATCRPTGRSTSSSWARHGRVHRRDRRARRRRRSRVLAIDLEPDVRRAAAASAGRRSIACARRPSDLERLVAARDLAPVDHIVSGLPFASLPVDDDAPDSGRHRARRCGPGGTFTTFQYLHGYGMRPGRAFRQEMSERMGGPPHRRSCSRTFRSRSS